MIMELKVRKTGVSPTAKYLKISAMFLCFVSYLRM